MIVHLCTQRSAVIIKNANLPGRESSAFTNILCSVCILCEVPAWHVGLHQDEGEDPIGYSLQPWKESVKSRAFRQQLHTFANKKLPSCLLILLRLFLTHQHVCTFLAFLKKAEGPSRHRISVKLQTFAAMAMKHYMGRIYMKPLGLSRGQMQSFMSTSVGILLEIKSIRRTILVWQQLAPKRNTTISSMHTETIWTQMQCHFRPWCVAWFAA